MATQVNNNAAYPLASLYVGKWDVFFFKVI